MITQGSFHCNKQPKASQTSNWKEFTDRKNLSYIQKLNFKPNITTKLSINSQREKERNGATLLVSVWNCLLGKEILKYAWRSPYQTATKWSQSGSSVDNKCQSIFCSIAKWHMYLCESLCVSWRQRSFWVVLYVCIVLPLAANSLF